MKKTIALLMAVLLLLLAACHRDAELKKPVSFYYPNAQITYGTKDGLLSLEMREGDSLDHTALLELYLKGPSDPGLSTPFPKGVRVIECTLQESTVSITLSDRYAELTGIDLSVANACLAKTAIELTGAQEVIIRCRSKQLDGEDYAVLSESTLLLFDSSTTDSSKTDQTSIPTE